MTEIATKHVDGIDKDNELVQYFVVNKDLGMSAGKVGAQVAHVATATAVARFRDENMSLYDKTNFDIWCDIAMVKVVLEASEEEMLRLLGEHEEFYTMVDEGRTEVANNSLTVIGMMPMKRKDAQKIIGHLPILGAQRTKNHVELQREKQFDAMLEALKELRTELQDVYRLIPCFLKHEEALKNVGVILE